jgi:mono/diheme cytochrome c family protein
MRKVILVLLALAVVGAAAAFYLSRPQALAASDIPAGHKADLANGERMYNAGGCISCHKPAEEDTAADKNLPSGGHALVTPAGTFYPPNLTPDKETGLGAWSDLDFVNAMQRGVSPSGEHLIPAFPYTSYAKMRIGDVLDIKAYLMTLKPVRAVARPAELPLGLPVEWLARRSVGLWKLLAFSPAPFRPDPSHGETWNLGAYLVSAPGHCSECHTPRNFLMVPQTGKWLAGGPHPEGNGKVPSLRDLVGRERYKDAADLDSALRFGETFGYDKLSSGGMGSVQTNLSKLPEADTKAIAEYLVSLK